MYFTGYKYRYVAINLARAGKVRATLCRTNWIEKFRGAAIVEAFP